MAFEKYLFNHSVRNIDFLLYFRWKHIIIGNSQLISRIPLNIESTNIDDVLKYFKTFPFTTINVFCKRYSQGKINPKFDKKLLKIIQFHSSHLIKLNLNSVKRNLCLEILKISKNIQELELDLVDDDDFKDSVVINLQSLKIFKIFEDKELIQLIRAESLDILIIYKILDPRVLQDFLAISSKLKALIVANSVKDLYESESELKLQKLVCNFKTYNPTSLIEFLQVQNSTLQDLTIEIDLKSSKADELFQHVLFNLKLKELSMTFGFGSINLLCRKVNHTITELSLRNIQNNEDFEKILRCFCSVTKLELFLGLFKESFNMKTIQDVLPGLKSLFLDGCIMNIPMGTSLNSLEYLKIFTSSRVNNKVNWLQIAYLCPNIKKLEISDLSLTISMLDMQKVLLSCKYLQVINISGLFNVEILEDFYCIHLNKLINLRNINVFASNADDVIEKMKNCCVGDSKFRAYTEIDQSLVHERNLMRFLMQKRLF